MRHESRSHGEAKREGAGTTTERPPAGGQQHLRDEVQWVGERKSTDVLVVGGSAAGLTAAITARRHHPDRRILLLRREAKVLVPCGIPYIFGTLGSPDKNLIPDTVLQDNDIELKIGEALALDPARHRVSLVGGGILEYDRLVLATGSNPTYPPIPGLEKQNVFAVCKDVDYLRQMQQALQSAKELVIIGGGFIGVELADECRKLGDVNVSIVEAMPHCLNLAFDEEFCQVAEARLAESGIKTYLRHRVREISGGAAVTGVVLDNGEELRADAVVLGIGSQPNVSLAKAAGLEIGPTGGVAVDRWMRTSAGDIFACGDCAEKVSYFDGKPCNQKLASIATVEARIAAANLYEDRRENAGTLSAWGTVVGGTALGGAGMTEAMAIEAGYDVAVGVAEAPNRHPGSMPGMCPTKVKLVFDRSRGTLLGGELVGGHDIGGDVNVISALIQGKANADEIAVFQMATHPALTASPLVYQIANAAEAALRKMRLAPSASL